MNLFVLGGEIANFEAPTPRDDMVSRARRGRAAQPWLSAVEGAVAKSDPMHAGTRATFAKLRFFTVLGHAPGVLVAKVGVFGANLLKQSAD